MGRPAKRVPRYGGHIDSTPQSRGSTPNVPAGLTPLVPTEGALGIPHEGYPTHSEISEHALDSLSATFSPSPLLSGLAGVSSPPRNESMLDVVSPPTPQHSELSLPFLSTASNNPGRALPMRSTHGSVPNPRESANPAIPIGPKPPQVKAYILCTGRRDLPVLQDAGLSMQGLAHVRKLDPDHVITHTKKLIDVSFDKFFDPTDIRKGGLLILIISCHGQREYSDGVSLDFQTQDGKFVNSSIIVDTCFAEGLIPGVRRILAMEPSTSIAVLPEVPTSTTAYVPLLDTRFSAEAPVFPISPGAEPSTYAAGLLKDSTTSNEHHQGYYEAQVVVWAASTKQGRSYPEADLPGKPGIYSIVIGAIFNHFSSHGPDTTRKDVWESIMHVKAVEQQNNARRERDLCKPLWVRACLLEENRIQRPILLTSVNNPERVLSGFMFQPIRKVRKTSPD